MKKSKIKFRGKNIHTGEWLYGDYHREGKTHYITKPEDYLREYAPIEFIVDGKTVGQFTGLYDKNGSPIYEGDIVKTPLLDPIFGDILSDAFDNAPIEFSNGSFVVSYYNGNHKIYIQDLYDKIEVIGNIHDTPELITSKQ